jgi:hypothetical protein
MVALALATVLYAEARLSSWGIRPPAWSAALRWFTGLAATLMNCWTSLWPDGRPGWPHHADPAAVLLHAIPPLLLILLTETVAAYRRHLTPPGRNRPAPAPPPPPAQGRTETGPTHPARNPPDAPHLKPSRPRHHHPATHPIARPPAPPTAVTAARPGTTPCPTPAGAKTARHHPAAARLHQLVAVPPVHVGRTRTRTRIWWPAPPTWTGPPAPSPAARSASAASAPTWASAGNAPAASTTASNPVRVRNRPRTPHPLGNRRTRNEPHESLDLPRCRCDARSGDALDVAAQVERPWS